MEICWQEHALLLNMTFNPLDTPKRYADEDVENAALGCMHQKGVMGINWDKDRIRSAFHQGIWIKVRDCINFIFNGYWNVSSIKVCFCRLESFVILFNTWLYSLQAYSKICFLLNRMLDKAVSTTCHLESVLLRTLICWNISSDILFWASPGKCGWVMAQNGGCP